MALPRFLSLAWTDIGTITTAYEMTADADPRDPVGKTLAYTSIRFTNEQEELVARGSHTK
jgi:acyl-coenzyme A thioesterase PaaI-like protein